MSDWLIKDFPEEADIDWALELSDDEFEEIINRICSDHPNRVPLYERESKANPETLSASNCSPENTSIAQPNISQPTAWQVNAPPYVPSTPISTQGHFTRALNAQPTLSSEFSAQFTHRLNTETTFAQPTYAQAPTTLTSTLNTSNAQILKSEHTYAQILNSQPIYCTQRFNSQLKYAQTLNAETNPRAPFTQTSNSQPTYAQTLNSQPTFTSTFYAQPSYTQSPSTQTTLEFNTQADTSQSIFSNLLISQPNSSPPSSVQPTYTQTLNVEPTFTQSTYAQPLSTQITFSQKLNSQPTLTHTNKAQLNEESNQQQNFPHPNYQLNSQFNLQSNLQLNAQFNLQPNHQFDSNHNLQPNLQINSNFSQQNFQVNSHSNLQPNHQFDSESNIQPTFSQVINAQANQIQINQQQTIHLKAQLNLLQPTFTPPPAQSYAQLNEQPTFPWNTESNMTQPTYSQPINAQPNFSQPLESQSSCSSPLNTQQSQPITLQSTWSLSAQPNLQQLPSQSNQASNNIYEGYCHPYRKVATPSFNGRSSRSASYSDIALTPAAFNNQQAFRPHFESWLHNPRPQLPTWEKAKEQPILDENYFNLTKIYLTKVQEHKLMMALIEQTEDMSVNAHPKPEQRIVETETQTKKDTSPQSSGYSTGNSESSPPNDEKAGKTSTAEDVAMTTNENALTYTSTPIRRRHKNQVCTFCLKNGELPEVYESHITRDIQGKVMCPILQQYTCQICGATGFNAHTRNYCPQNQERTPNLPPYRLLSNGSISFSHHHK